MVSEFDHPDGWPQRPATALSVDQQGGAASMAHDVLRQLTPKPGFPVRIMAADGVWRDAVTRSGIEGTHMPDPHTGQLRKVHDFPIIWVEVAGAAGDTTYLPWPTGYVEPRICTCRHDRGMHIDGRCTDVQDVGVPWDKPCDCTTFTPMENPDPAWS